MEISLDDFLAGLSSERRHEAEELITLMEAISHECPKLWGSDVIGFGRQSYSYGSGQSNEMPRLSFSARTAQVIIYFNEGFDRYAEQLSILGAHTTSMGCLYIKNLRDIDIATLGVMLYSSFQLSGSSSD